MKWIILVGFFQPLDHSSSNSFVRAIDNHIQEKKTENFGSCLSLEDTIRFFKRNNKVTNSFEEDKLPIKVSDGTEIIRYSYSPDSPLKGSPLSVYIVKNGGHGWPEGIQYMSRSLVGVSSGNLNACQTIIDFFRNCLTTCPISHDLSPESSSSSSLSSSLSSSSSSSSSSSWSLF